MGAFGGRRPRGTIYDASRNTVTVFPLSLRIHQREVARGGDLADRLRQMVDSCQATATPTTYSGISAYELSIHASGDTFFNGNAYVARSDYRSLEIDSTANGGGKVVVSTYEYVRATPAVASGSTR